MTKISKDVTITVEAEVTKNDIFNWLTACDDVKTLRYLGKYALRCAEAIEHPDYDDFRSRA